MQEFVAFIARVIRRRVRYAFLAALLVILLVFATQGLTWTSVIVGLVVLFFLAVLALFANVWANLFADVRQPKGRDDAR